MQRQLIKTVIIGAVEATQDEITRSARKISPYIRHAIRRSQHKAIYAAEYAEIAAKIKQIREEKEESQKQMEFSL